MECTEFEELVRHALLEANCQEYEQFLAQTDTIAFNPSARYLAWERKFLADPFGYARRQQKRIMQFVACGVLAATAIFGLVVAVHNVRARSKGK